MQFVCLLVGCLTSQQQASVSHGRICSDNFTCCHTEIEVADPTFYLTQSQHTDTGPTSPSADPVTPGAWQGSQFLSHWYDSTPKKSRRRRESNPGSSALEADALTTRPTRLFKPCRQWRYTNWSGKTLKRWQSSNTSDKPHTSKTLQKKKSMPGSEQHGAVLEKKHQEILQDRQLPILPKKQVMGPMCCANNGLWLPNMVSQ